MPYYQYFPPELLALQQELFNHPDLCRQLATHASGDVEEKFAEIAAYCEVILDGVYTEQDLCKLADILTRKLKEKNSLIIRLH